MSSRFDWLIRSAPAIGLIAWIGRLSAVGIEPTQTHWAVTLFLLSPLVIVPLVLATLDDEFDQANLKPQQLGRCWEAARWLQLPSAWLLLAATAIPPSWISFLCCVPWTFTSMLVAATGGGRLLRRGWRPLDATCVDIGLGLLPIGAAWLGLWRLGVRPLGFEEVIVMLTAIHFHFAGFVLPLLAGWSARIVPGRWATLSGLGVIAGVPAVAMGITATQLGWPSAIEASAACGLSLAGISTACLQLEAARRIEGTRLGRPLLILSSVALLATMVLAMLYGLRSVHHWRWLDIPWMRAWHGTGNALGACLLGVLGWKAVHRRPKTGAATNRDVRHRESTRPDQLSCGPTSLPMRPEDA